MQDSPATSFMRFLFGFTLFISLSFGIAFAANSIASTQDSNAAVAAAEAAMLR